MEIKWTLRIFFWEREKNAKKSLRIMTFMNYCDSFDLLCTVFLQVSQRHIFICKQCELFDNGNIYLHLTKVMYTVYHNVDSKLVL